MERTIFDQIEEEENLGAPVIEEHIKLTKINQLR
jgi:hypothetical protein